MPCGRDCSCCDFGDGTASVDHTRDCDLVKGGWGRDPSCTCEGALHRALERMVDSLHYWECVVIEVREDSFTAILRDTERKTPDLIGDIQKKEVPLEDHSWIVLGAVFDWGISPFASEIRFRKEVWTKEEIGEMKAKGKELYELFGKSGDTNE